MDIVKLIQQTERRAKAKAELAKYKNTPELQRWKKETLGTNKKER